MSRMCAKNLAKIFANRNKCWLFLDLYYEKMQKLSATCETKGLFWKNIWMIWDFDKFAKKYLFFGKCSPVLRIFLRKCQFFLEMRVAEWKNWLFLQQFIYFHENVREKQKVLGYFCEKFRGTRNEWRNIAKTKRNFAVSRKRKNAISFQT